MEADGSARTLVPQTISKALPAQLDFQLGAGHTLSGPVTDSSTAEAISGAFLKVVDSRWPEYDPGLYVTVGADGTYSVTDLPDGHYRIQTYVEGYVTTEAETQITDSLTHNIALADDGHVLAGQLVEADGGLPVAHALVILQKDGFLPIVKETADDGTFEFLSLGTGSFRVFVVLENTWIVETICVEGNQVVVLEVDLTLENVAVASETSMRFSVPPASTNVNATAPLSDEVVVGNIAVPSSSIASTSADPPLDVPMPGQCREAINMYVPLLNKWRSLRPLREALERARSELDRENRRLLELQTERADMLNKVITRLRMMEVVLKLHHGQLPELAELEQIRIGIHREAEQLLEAVENGDTVEDYVFWPNYLLKYVPHFVKYAGSKALGTLWSVVDLIRWSARLVILIRDSQNASINVALCESAYSLQKAVLNVWSEEFYKMRDEYLDALDKCKEKDPDPKGEVKDKEEVQSITSISPEDKFGPAGFDALDTPPGSEVRYIPAGQELHYRIDIWNKPDADAPTQDAIIEDVLDPAVFDTSSFEFTRVGFLKWDMPLPGGQAIDTRIDMRPDMNLAVDVTGSFDPETGEIRWWFHAVDPMTGDYPEDPFAGFLPPFNPETGYEIGWMEYTVQHRPELASGTQLINQALVQFGFLGPWINTIDAEIPADASHVLPLLTYTNETTFLVEWTGADEANGSGIAHYDVYYRMDDDDPWVDDSYVLWMENTADTSALFAGELGHTYAFYTVATDNVGHRQATPDTPDTQTTINRFPTADPGGPYSVAEGGLVTLDASASSDPEQTDNTTLTYEWDFDYDGLTFNVDATGISPDFSASAIDGPNIRTIGLRATDDGGLSDTATTTVDVTNVSPTATITGSSTTSPEGMEILLHSSIADPAPADTAAGFSYSWNVTKDGAAYDSGTGDTFRITPNDNGSYQVTLIVTDKDSGVSDPATTTIEIQNVMPTIIVEGGDTVAEGAEYSLTPGTITDPGIDTVTQWIVYWGDGEIDTYAAGGEKAHIYENDGTYTITVDLADEDGTHTGAGSLNLTVNPAGPEVIDLGEVNFRLLEQLSLVDGNLYFRIETTHEGFLTLQVDVPGPSKSARLKLYDADPVETTGLTPLTKSALDENGNQRIDWPTLAGTVFYAEAYGSNVDFAVRVANLVSHVGTSVTVHGTDSDDTFEFDAAASRDVTINGVRYQFEDAEVESVTFNGGHDKAYLYDSDANDKFKSEPAENYAKMYGGRMYNRVKFFDVVEAFSSGQKDLARLFDTQGNDVFEGQQEVSWLRTDVFDVGVHNFRRVIAYSNEGGFDEATLKDSVLGDELHLKNHKSEIFDLATKGEVYKITARRFDALYGDASAGDGYDKVKMWETLRDNHLEAADNWTRMWAQKAELEMIYDILAFEFVKVRASTGGNDTTNVTEPLDFDLLFEDG